MNEIWLSRTRHVLTSPAFWIALCVLGLAARGRQIVGSPSYWYDEAPVVLNVMDHSCTELLGCSAHGVVLPPLFLWLLRGLCLLWGTAEWVMRLPAAIAGIASLLLMVPLAKRLLSDRAWIWAVVFSALSHHALAHSYDVKPYTSEFVCTQLVLLCSAVLLDPLATPREKTRSRWGLWLMAALAPWYAFASLFVLAGSSLALLADRIRPRAQASQPVSWLDWSLFNAVMAASCGLLWFVHARHLYVPGLQEHWRLGWDAFPASRAPLPLAAWTVRALIQVCHYATTSMGIPLLLLGMLGLARIGRRAPALGVLLTAPIVLLWMAALLGRYPMGDRMVFFLAPCVWLLAAEGLHGLVSNTRPTVAWTGIACLAVLLVPGIYRTGKHVASVRPRMDFRGAFEYAEAHQQARDAWCVSHLPVYEVYFGRSTPCCDVSELMAGAQDLSQASHLWVIAALPPDMDFRALEAPLHQKGITPAERMQFAGGIYLLRCDLRAALPQR